jgi:hypothetical protein
MRGTLRRHFRQLAAVSRAFCVLAAFSAFPGQRRVQHWAARTLSQALETQEKTTEAQDGDAPDRMRSLGTAGAMANAVSRW